MAVLDIRTTPYDMKIHGIKFDESTDVITFSDGVYILNQLSGRHRFLAEWADFDNLIMALKKAKELHELQQGGKK